MTLPNAHHYYVRNDRESAPVRRRCAHCDDVAARTALVCRFTAAARTTLRELLRA